MKDNKQISDVDAIMIASEIEPPREILRKEFQEHR